MVIPIQKTSTAPLKNSSQNSSFFCQSRKKKEDDHNDLGDVFFDRWNDGWQREIRITSW